MTESTRTKIEKYAKKVRYRPNKLIRAIQTGQSGLVGVVMKPSSEWTARLLLGIHEGLHSDGFLPILDWLPSHLERPASKNERTEIDVINNLLDHRVDGIIVYPTDENITDLYFTEVWKRGYPLVTIDRLASKTHADFVGTDEDMGAKIAAGHLLKLGHRSFGQLAGYQGYGTYLKRSSVFEQTVRAAGGSCHTVEVEQFENATRAAGLLLQNRQQKSPPFTAVFLGNDRYHRHLFNAAQSLGIRIPEDLSVIGYGGLNWGELSESDLTTIKQDPFAMGKVASGAIIQRVREKASGQKQEPPRRYELPPLLLERGTCAAPS